MFDFHQVLKNLWLIRMIKITGLRLPHEHEIHKCSTRLVLKDINEINRIKELNAITVSLQHVSNQLRKQTNKQIKEVNT